MAKKRNPIIFARTETSHIPKSLQTVVFHKELLNAVYSASEDGSLKQTPTENTEETKSTLPEDSKRGGVGFTISCEL